MAEGDWPADLARSFAPGGDLVWCGLGLDVLEVDLGGSALLDLGGLALFDLGVAGLDLGVPGLGLEVLPGAARLGVEVDVW